MFTIDTKSRIPIYEQIKDEILNYISLGLLQPDECLPSIRSVASSSSVNVNTVKKAFSQLERDGIIYTVAGKGCFVAPDAKENSREAQKALADLRPLINSAKSKGVGYDELVALIDKIYGRDNNA